MRRPPSEGEGARRYVEPEERRYTLRQSVLVVETVVHLGQLQFLLELASGGVLVDDGELNTGDAGEVFPSLRPTEVVMQVW